MSDFWTAEAALILEHGVVPSLPHPTEHGVVPSLPHPTEHEVDPSLSHPTEHGKVGAAVKLFSWQRVPRLEHFLSLSLSHLVIHTGERFTVGSC